MRNLRHPRLQTKRPPEIGGLVAVSVLAPQRSGDTPVFSASQDSKRRRPMTRLPPSQNQPGNSSGGNLLPVLAQMPTRRQASAKLMISGSVGLIIGLDIV